MPDQNWKKAFLGSGLPLEHSVREVLHELGFEHPTDLAYARPSGDSDRDFSIDVYASQVISGSAIGHSFAEFLVECKYVTRGTKWVFVPEQAEGDWAPRLSDLFLCAGVFTGATINRSAVDALGARYRYCYGGVELRDGHNNKSAIPHALAQLQYAVGHRIGDAVGHNAVGALGAAGIPFAIIPMIVTTAEIYCLRNDVGLSEIEGASEIDEVADRLDSLILVREPTRELQDHTREAVLAAFAPWGLENVDGAFRSLPKHGDGRTFAENFASAYPSQFLVVQWSGFRDAARRLLAFLDGPTFWSAL
jgi:hypothetical protein